MNAQVGCYGCDTTCDEAIRGIKCTPRPYNDPQCFCMEGYYMLTESPYKECVPFDQCPKKSCGPKDIKRKQKACGCNEVAKCSGCDDRCQSWYSPPCAMRYYDEAYCFCQDGYIRFADGVCRKREECKINSRISV